MQFPSYIYDKRVMLELHTPVTALKMVGLTYASKLKKLGIETVGDLLYHVPSRYENYSLRSNIKALQIGERVTVIGTVKDSKNIYTKGNKKIQKIIIADSTAEIEIIWYNQPFLPKILVPGLHIAIAGIVTNFGNKKVFESPDYEIIKTSPLVHTGRLVPIYPETAGLSSKWIRSRINAIFQKFTFNIPEFLPQTILTEFQLIGRKNALMSIHFPKNEKEIEHSRKRLTFDELFILRLSGEFKRKKWQTRSVGLRFEVDKFEKKFHELITTLPFALTNAQERCINDICTDLAKIQPMNRLLEGDVGSGKTVVAAIGCYLTYLNGYTAVFMAPTEILALQHFKTISDLLKPFGVTIALVTANNKKGKTSSADVLIGTHALLSRNLKVKKLGLVIIDEQQRFGVEQRYALRKKGDNPHLLAMTATPIPRSIALTIFADLDLSVLDEMPKGRNIVKTWLVPQEKRSGAYNWIRKQINTFPKKQAFIVCPLIENSENFEAVKAVKAEYEKLKKDIYPDLKVGLMHGGLNNTQKDKVIKNFKNGKIDILVSTSVVEVGIDIPMATIMMIEASERFGLAQLHQLRGRVGRNNFQSFCLLFTNTTSQKGINRLKLMESLHSGPKLAEMDLTLRGPGELFGLRQHGDFGLKIAKFSDLETIEKSKIAVKKFINGNLKFDQFPLLREMVQKYTIQMVAPD